MPELDMKFEEEMISALKPIQIPPQPQLLIDMEAAGRDIQKVALLVGEDPSVAAAVIKTVNSPFFGIAKKVTDIKQATMLLGLDTIRNIVNAVLIQSAFSERSVDQLTTFWQSTNDVAAAAAIVAKNSKGCADNEAYLLGLFHNAGIPLMLEKHADYMQTLAQAYDLADENLTMKEDEQYKANHAVVGYYISRTWHLPKKISIAIRDHHERSILTDLANNEDTEMAYLLAALKMGEYLANEHDVLGPDTAGDYEWQAIQESITDFLGLTDEDIANCRDILEENAAL